MREGLEALLRVVGVAVAGFGGAVGLGPGGGVVAGGGGAGEGVVVVDNPAHVWAWCAQVGLLGGGRTGG